MTIVKLKQILQKEKIDPGDYDILNKRYLKNYDGFIIDKGPKGTLRLYYCERAEYTLLQESTDEDFICREFLRMMARGHKQLAKYV